MLVNMEKYNITPKKICYCFNYTAEDIRNDFQKNGKSTIMDSIMNEKKNGKCNCESTNPKGR